MTCYRMVLLYSIAQYNECGVIFTAEIESVFLWYMTCQKAAGGIIHMLKRMQRYM